MIPQPPPGFKLDQAEGEIPPPPPGFTLDAMPKTSTGGGYFKSKVLPDVAANVVGLASGVKAGLYDIPKALFRLPGQIARGTPPTETDIGQFTKQGTQGIAQDLTSMVTDPAGYAYNKPVSTALFAAGMAKPAIRTAGRMSAPLFKKGLSLATGPSTEAIDARLAAPSEVANAPTIGEVATSLPKTFGKLADRIKDLSKQAYGTLTSSPYLEEGALTKDEILSSLQGARRNLGGTFSQENLQASRALKKAEEFYSNKLHSTVSQAQVKELIDQLDNDINWDAIEPTKTDEVLMNLRGRLDSLLKGKNTDYEASMVPVDDQMRLMKDAQRLFGIQKRRGEDFSLKADTTVNRLQNAMKENKVVTQKTMERIKGSTGVDLPKKVRFAEYRRQFEEPAQNLPLAIKASVGTIAGTAIGHTAGGIIGGIAGYLLNEYGPKLAAVITDRMSVAMPKIEAMVSKLPSETAQKAFVTSLVSRNFPDLISELPEIGKRGKPLDENQAREYLRKANGDKAMARKMAREGGFTF